MWRTAPTGTEGTATVYVDSFTGSDLQGDGTRDYPYQSLSKAWAAETKPSLIVCRGVFSETITGDNNCLIAGDYWGAAYFEGQSLYTIYQFMLDNFIIRNCPTNNGDNKVGVGGRGAGGETYASGLVGNNVILSDCALCYGLIGSNQTSMDFFRVIWAHPINIRGEHYKIKVLGLRSNNGDGSGNMFHNNTLYDCDIADREKHKANKVSDIKCCIFAKFAMIANESTNDVYKDCLFTADTNWYCIDGYGNATQMSVTGNTSAERQQSLLNSLEAWYTDNNIAVAQRTYPDFTNCVFSGKTSSKIFNNPEKDDFTLIPGCDADAQFGDSKYCGALPPALNVPIMSDSSETPATWDERSASGCLKVADNMICIDSEKSEMVGSIHSKVIRIDPVTTQLNGIFAVFHNRWKEYNVYADKHSIFRDYTNSPDGTNPDEYTTDSDLSDGLYLSTAAATYMGDSIGPGGIVRATSGTRFSSSDANAKFIKIVEPNVADCVFVRCRSQVYAHVKAAGNDELLADRETNTTALLTTELQVGATYFNDGDKDIRYRQRTIVPGESFVCLDSTDYFTCPDDPDYEIAIIFDDSRVPAASQWVPAQHFGEYFVAKEAGSIKSAYGIPMGSGNPHSYPDSGLYKSTADRVFVQFAIFVNKYESNID